MTTALVALLAVAAAVAALAPRLSIPAPLALTVVGLVASFVPGVPNYTFSNNHDIVLIGFLPPLLYATAIKTPFVNIRRERRPIALLSVALVLVTALAVAAVVMSLLPGLPFPAALALGAVVAPPDAVAATAVARQVGMPRRMVTILEGESLLNDATALVTLRTATGALAAGAAGVSVLGVSLDFARAVVLGVLAGVLVAALATSIRRRVTDSVIDTTLSLLVPYIAYLCAESVQGSGVLAVVVAGLILGHRSADIQSAASRVTERTIWRTVQFMLESVVFMLIGLQLRDLLLNANAASTGNARIALVCGGVALTVIVVRVLWMFPATYLPLLIPAIGRAEPRPTWQAVTLVSWAGMRGVVTLAAAFSLSTTMPYRDVLVIAAFSVVAVTLLVQGASLPALVRLLKVHGPDPAHDALQQALVLQRAADAGQQRLLHSAGETAPREVVDMLRSWSERLTHAVWERLATTSSQGETPGHAYRRLRIDMLDAERRVVVDLHRTGTVAAEVLDEVLERFDQEEALLATFADDAAPGRTELRSPPNGDLCEHLRNEPVLAVPSDPEGCRRCLDLGQRSWVALRMCLRCGNVGCCDSSPNRHATEHFTETGHPVMRSIELGEGWRWCYVDRDLG